MKVQAMRLLGVVVVVMPVLASLLMTAEAQSCTGEKHPVDQDAVCNYVMGKHTDINMTEAWGRGCAGGVRLTVNESCSSCVWMGKADDTNPGHVDDFAASSSSEMLYFRICCLLKHANHTFSISSFRPRGRYVEGRVTFYISLGKPEVCFFFQLSEMNVLSSCADKQQWCYMKPPLSSVQALPTPSQTPPPIGTQNMHWIIPYMGTCLWSAMVPCDSPCVNLYSLEHGISSSGAFPLIILLL